MKAYQWGIRLPKMIGKFHFFLLRKGYQIKFENIVVTLNVTRDLIFCVLY
jgi:hypothetical protein